MKPIKIKWVLAHEPVELFIRAAEKFKEVLEQKAPGYFDIEILLLSEYSNKYNNGKKVMKSDLIDHVKDGRIEMSQMYTYVLSRFNDDLHALDLPFMFKDHEHAARVFEGPIGQSMLAGYSKGDSKILGMAFTYSGGYKNIALAEEVQNLSELGNAKIRISNSPVSKDTFASIGADPVNLEIEQLTDAMRDGRVDGGECSWPRLYSLDTNTVTRTIIDTKHSLLLTNIIVNTDFFNELPEDICQIMMEAAVEAGRYERQISIDDVGPTSQRARDDGIHVIELSDDEQNQFRQRTEHLYEKYKDRFTPGLINAIKQA